MKKLGVVITDGVGFRNFILSDFMNQANLVFDEVIILSCLPKEVYKEKVDLNKVIELDVFTEHFSTWLLRKLKEVTHLQIFAPNNFGINANLEKNYSKAFNFRGLATRLIFVWSRYIKSEKWINRYNKWQQKSFANNRTTKDYEKIINNQNLDLLFFTHQRPSYIAPLIYVANKLKVKTASFIFSWDNLTSKGRMAGDFDYYLVWSNLMKNELLHFYPSINYENIEIVGTPQFEPYVMPKYFMEKKAFFDKFGLNEYLIITYSCGDVSTSKNDPLYVEIIAKAIMENRITNPVNFIVRTSPAEEPTRFNQIKNDYPLIVWNYPKWVQARSEHAELWSQRIPSEEDILDLRALMCYSAININMCSTMSLDFMLFDKNVINPVLGNSQNKLYDDQKYLSYKHYEAVVESGAVDIAKSENELIDFINENMENPNRKLQNQKKILELQIGKPLKGTGKRIAETLRQWS